MKLQELFESRNEYNSFKSWKAAVKKKNPEAWIEGDEDIAQAMVGPKPYKKGETKSIGEWDGAKGELFEDQGFNKFMSKTGEKVKMRDGEGWWVVDKRNWAVEGTFVNKAEAEERRAELEDEEDEHYRVKFGEVNDERIVESAN